MCYISFVGSLYASFKLVITRATAYLSVTCVLRIHDVSASNELPCFPDNKTGLILIFTPKYGTRAYFRGMYYFDISKNEVTK